MEMWRALRLVVDTGIHWHSWSRERAIDTMAQHMALPRPTIEAEVDRYISWPGQALAYQIGNLEFRRLRSLAESRLGIVSTSALPRRAAGPPPRQPAGVGRHRRRLDQPPPSAPRVCEDHHARG